MTVILTGAHVPVEVREPLEVVLALNATANELRRRLDVAHPDTRPELQQQIDDTTAAAHAAYSALETATANHAPQMRQSAAGAFAAAIERARAHITEAETELRDAAEAVALYVSIRNGQATINTDTERARRSKTREHCMRNVSDLRDVLGDLPDGIDD
jgi:hypothetical protein